MENKNPRSKYYACLFIGIFGVIFGPWLFTHPYPLNLQSLDFSQTGSIGDTIGGIFSANRRACQYPFIVVDT